MTTERPAEQLHGESSGDSTQSKLRARFSRLRPRRTDESEKKKQLQEYLAWVNNYLKRRPGAHLISDLRSGLQDGVALVNLVEVVANAEIPFVERVPTSHAARKANIQKAISFLTSDGVRLQGDPVKDIMDGNVKGVLRVILAIAEKYNPRSVRCISSEIQNTPLQETRPAATSFRTGSPDRLMPPHDLSSSLPNTSPLAASSMTVTNMPTAGVSLSQVTPASSVPMPGLSLSQGVAGGPMFLSQPAPVVDSIYSTPVDSLPQNVVQRISSHMPSHRLIGQRNIRPTGPHPRAPSPKQQLPPMKETEDEGMVSLQPQHELGVVLKQLSVFKSELLGLHSLLIENGDTDVTDGKDMNAFASSELLSKEKEIVALHQEMLLLKEQLEKDHSERQTLHGMVQERNQFITTMKSELYRKEYRNDTERVDLQTQILQKDKIIGTLEAEIKGLKEDVDVKGKARIDVEEASTQHKVEQQKEKEQIRSELQAMKEELHKLMKKKQQLQKELLAANTILEDSQRQKKKDALSLETLGIEEHDTVGGGEDPSSLQLTQDDVIHAYDVCLRASKEKEQQLQSQLATVQQEFQDKEQQLSKLEDENYDLHKKMMVLRHEYELQQEKLNQKGVDVKLLVAEKQQWLLHQRMSRAKDMQISKLQYAVDQMQGKSVKPWPVATVDTGIQADYLAVAPDFLRGVEVYGETVLEVVGDKPQKLEWPGYGFYMEVPDGALATGMTASVGVKVILSGQFKLPEHRQLISAIYWISSSEVFLKEVAINIQHFAIITSEEQCSKCSFIIAKCSQRELPYTFREKPGSFNPHTQYGTIKLKQFSLVGETSSEDTELRYTTLKFYKPIPSTVMVDFIFVVVCNHELFLEFIRQEYHSYTEDRQNQMLVFKNDVVVLDLPAAGLLVDDWKIVPLTHPQIAKVDILQFKRGKNLPACSIQLEWTKSGNPRRLFHQVNIIGANKPDDYFYMRYYPQAQVVAQDVTSLSTNITADQVAATSVTRNGVSSDPMSPLDTKPALVALSCYKYKDTEGRVQRIYIIDEIAAKWRRVGLSLNFSASDLDNIESSCQGKVEECSERLLIQWLDGNISTQLPITWETLLDALRDARLGQLAETLTDSMTLKSTRDRQ